MRERDAEKYIFQPILIAIQILLDFIRSSVLQKNKPTAPYILDNLFTPFYF